MNQSKADILLHPIRIRIITELIRQDLSPQRLAKLLPDIPQATLYRHINTLAEADILEIVSETPIRGTVEKVYRMREGAGRLSPDEIQDLSAEEHVQYFTTFAASLIGDFTRFIENTDKDDPDILSGNLSYSKTLFYLSDEEVNRLRETIASALQAALKNPPTPSRKRYMVALVSIPDKSENKE